MQLLNFSSHPGVANECGMPSPIIVEIISRTVMMKVRNPSPGYN